MQPPVPVPDPISEGFWRATAQRRLDIQRCKRCRHLNHIPLPQCPKCRSIEFEWHTVSGRGVIYESAIVHESRVSGFEGSTPYAVVLVELEEQKGLFILGNLREAPVNAAKVGAPVEVIFEEIGGGFVLPQFRPTPSNS